MWHLTQPWWEFILRAVLIYFTIFLLFRIMGKKQLGQMSPFDLILLLIVSESVSNGLGAADSSLTAALISASTLLSMSYFMDLMAFKSKKFEKWIEGEPQIIIANGKVRQSTRKKEMITPEELKSALRKENIDDVKDVKYAILETNGKLTVIKK